MKMSVNPVTLEITQLIDTPVAVGDFYDHIPGKVVGDILTQEEADVIGVTKPTAPTIEQAKEARKARIKTEAAALITALDWRLERARERAEAGVTGVETVADVLAMREAIRVASSQAETDVDGLTDLASIQDFTWVI